jgi:hypothetical protein|nr:MAG TPA: hypothetical protein [Caudoviricetes sp.]
MELKINICTQENCRLTIQDITGTEGKGYLPESSSAIVKNRWKYSETMAIDVLVLNHSKGPKYQLPILNLHDPDNTNIDLPVGFDGWFDICHIVIPTKEWFFKNYEGETPSTELQLYETVYYSDGVNLFKYFNGVISNANIEEIVERNTEGTTISRISKTYVSICFLKKCYISLCQQIFNSRGFNECFTKGTIDSQLIFKRDLAWMSINVIKYMVQSNQLAEAERIIEQIGGCNGICKTEFNKWTDHDCGCSKG